MNRYPSHNEAWPRGIFPESASVLMKDYFGSLETDDVFSKHILRNLDLLPRNEFFGRLVRNVHVESREAAQRFELLAGASLSPPSENLYIDGQGIQLTEVRPDGMIETADLQCVLIVRKWRSELVKPCQWAGGLVLAHQHSPEKCPLFLVVFRSPPPIIVGSHGLQTLPEIIRLGLSEMCVDPDERAFYESSIVESVGWITWDEIASCITEGIQMIESAPYSNKDEIVRTARVSLLGMIMYRDNQ